MIFRARAGGPPQWQNLELFYLLAMGVVSFPGMNANSGIAFGRDLARLEMGQNRGDMIVTV